MLDDASEELAGDVQLLLRKLGEELVLFKHVSQHAHKQVLREGGREEREGGKWEGREGRKERGDKTSVREQNCYADINSLEYMCTYIHVHTN